jgi:hypothetical protein
VNRIEWSFERRMLAINALLFLAIAVSAMLLLTEERVYPPPPPVDQIADLMRQQNEMAVSTGAEPARDNYPAFGRSPVFDTLIPRPTPTLTPLPTPKPDPDLKEAIRNWKVGGIAGTFIFMSDERTREEWTFDTGIEEERSREVSFQGERMIVRVGEVDEMEFRVTFHYRGRQGLQMVEKSMFDE